MDYSKTLWKDHIKDQNGNVIQQGTPVSAQHLNNIENGLATAKEEINNNAGVVRESIPSGFTTLSDLDYGYMATNPNQIKLLSDSVAFVNGYKVTIPAGTVIQLDAPPVYDPIAKTGTPSRDDLVFLEVWKTPVTDTDGEKINWRIRVVDGVDFSKHPEGLRHGGEDANSPLVCPQGALNSPYVGVGSYAYSNYIDISSLKGDVGVFSTINAISGASVDGYVYAIPMFKVHRRNSGGYSANNGNGSNNYFTIIFNRPFIARNQTGQITNVTNYDLINVGDIFLSALKVPSLRVISKDGNNDITVQNIYTSDMTANSAVLYTLKNRPDLLYADILDDRDILDLRHQVSLTGFNYSELLEENFDKLLRGELQTVAKTKMLKTYHGISKTPIDANTVFYASLDGTTTAEVGGALNLGTGSFKPMPTGLGYKFPGIYFNAFSVSGIDKNNGTIDFLISLNDLKNDSNWATPVMLLDDGGNIFVSLILNKSAGIIYMEEYYSDASIISANCYYLSNSASSFIHVRMSWNVTKIYLRINGNLVTSSNRKSNSIWRTPTRLQLGGDNNISHLSKSVISDLSISNIDRGSNFATLPQDFIDGYARIAPAFNSQRNVFSDALTTETKQELINADSTKNKPYIKLGDSTDWIKDDSTKWNPSDKIKLDTLTQEIITGVLDSDTALAKVVQASTATSIYVDDVSKFTVGDAFTLNGGTSYTISAIDTTNKVLTVNTAVNTNVGDLLYETTTSSSSPLMKFNPSGTAQAGGTNTITLPATFSTVDDAYNGLAISIDSGTGAGQVKTISDYVGSTKVATVDSNWTTQPDNTSVLTVHNVDVGGTWSGLGTSEAIYTLPATLPSGLAAQNLALTYAITEMAGQGGIPEVLTQTLAGEYKGGKLTPNPSYHILDDFMEKVSGSVVENPNILRQSSGSSSLQPPSTFMIEATTNQYSYVALIGGGGFQSVASENNNIAQQLFAFDLISIVERKYGTIPGNTTADKVDWLKANIASIACSWYGYGSCPSGNKNRMAYYSGSWIEYSSSPFNYLAPTLVAGAPPVAQLIQPDGFVYFLAYTDASDGTTPSAIYTDYIDIQVALKTPSGSDVLAPENLRRDAGKSNILLVRKETKEIQLLFGNASNTDGIVTYGDYVPAQYLPSMTGEILAVSDKILITTAGTGGAIMNNGINPILDNIGLISPIKSSDFDNSVLSSDGGYSLNYIYSSKFLNYFNTNMNYIGMTMNSLPIKRYEPLGENKVVVVILYGLVLINHELYLKIIFSQNATGSQSYLTTGGDTYIGVTDIKIPYRPLIK